MAKRFTDTTKWDRANYRKLSCKAKVAWQYVCDKCDNVGIWHPDFETVSHFIGEEITESEFRAELGHKIVVLSNGAWFIPSFIEFQYGLPLKADCNAHKPVIAALAKYGIRLTNPTPTVPEQLLNSSPSVPRDTLGEREGKGSGLGSEYGLGKSEIAANAPAELQTPELESVYARRDLTPATLKYWLTRVPSPQWLAEKILELDAEADAPGSQPKPFVVRLRQFLNAQLTAAAAHPRAGGRGGPRDLDLDAVWAKHEAAKSEGATT